MRHLTRYFLLSIFLLSGQVFADDLRVTVTSEFINVHSGPATEFPVFHVISQSEQIDILKERTGWYKVRTVDKRGGDIEGWIRQTDLQATVIASGAQLKTADGDFDDYLQRSAEVSIMGGVLDSTTALNITGSWVWTKNLSVDASYTQALGDFSDNKVWSVRMRHTIFPEWQISPYLALGTGEIRTRPKSNLVQSGDEVRVSSHYEVGVGVRYYFTDGVLIRAEYRGLLALTDRDEQERIDQWMLGASIFF